MATVDTVQLVAFSSGQFMSVVLWAVDAQQIGTMSIGTVRRCALSRPKHPMASSQGSPDCDTRRARVCGRGETVILCRLPRDMVSKVVQASSVPAVRKWCWNCLGSQFLRWRVSISVAMRGHPMPGCV